MLRITLFQMRQNVGRLIAAAIAIVIGTAFIAATFMGGQVFVKSAEGAMTAQYGQSDVVVLGYKETTVDGYKSVEYSGVPVDLIEKIDALPEVAETSLSSQGWFSLVKGSSQEYLPFITQGESAGLNFFTYSEGKAPSAADEISLPVKFAERFGVAVGDDIAVTDGGDATQGKVSFKITGLTEDPKGAYTSYGGAAVTTLEGIQSIYSALDSGEMFAEHVLVAAEPSVAGDAVRLGALQDEITQLAGGLKVSSIEQITQDQLEALTGEANIIMSAVLAFAGIALLVAALVISNTFQVLVAQRARTLALLRCVGANTKQIKRSVLVEALILGFLASVAGVILGILLVQAILWVVSAVGLSASIPSVVSIPATAIWVPLVAGTLVTLLASFVPARVATRVAPLAALRPIEGVAETRGTAGKVRTVIAALLVLGGAGLLAFSFTLREDSLDIAVGLGILGGAASFVGLIISAVLWVPAVVSGVGKLFSKMGAPAQLAAANIARNPRRTASTATALFIGVTLVSLLSIGASTARSTLDRELDETFPIDLVAQFYQGADGKAVDANQTAQKVRAIDGVEYVYAARQTTVNFASQDGIDHNYVETETLVELSEDARNAMRDASVLDQLGEGKFLHPAYNAFKKDTPIWMFKNSDEIVGNGGPEEQPGWADRVELKSAGNGGINGIAVTSEVFEELVNTFGIDDSQVRSSTLFIKVSDLKNAGDTVDEIRDVLGSENVSLEGSVMQRLEFQKAIDIMLLILVGLLGVAVLIALIGVANTLSLSIIERRRENATLRAVGMSKRQLRASLAFEGMLIAGIGALVGVALGALYAWAGTQLLLSGMTDVAFSARWTDIAMIFAVALGAGLLASVIPARGAVKTSPVEALSVD